MRWPILIATALAAGMVALVWATGGFDQIARLAAEGQRNVQGEMGGALRRLRAGEAGALAVLLGLSFAYGFFHAAGPGHGKLVIGGYGLAREVPVMRLSLIALAASLAQALTAIGLVAGGIALLGLARPALEGAAEDWFAPASYAAIGAVGLWLVVRGLRGLRGGAAHCGHDHGPDPAAAARAGSLADAALLVGAVALRPCTGALFLLIVAHALGLWWSGVAGALAMGLGTATVTIAVAAAAALARGGAVRGIADGTAARYVLPTLELTAGCIVAAGALSLLSRTL